MLQRNEKLSANRGEQSFRFSVWKVGLWLTGFCVFLTSCLPVLGPNGEVIAVATVNATAVSDLGGSIQTAVAPESEATSTPEATPVEKPDIHAVCAGPFSTAICEKVAGAWASKTTSSTFSFEAVGTCEEAAVRFVIMTDDPRTDLVIVDDNLPIDPEFFHRVISSVVSELPNLDSCQTAVALAADSSHNPVPVIGVGWNASRSGIDGRDPYSHDHHLQGDITATEAGTYDAILGIVGLVDGVWRIIGFGAIPFP